MRFSAEISLSVFPAMQHSCEGFCFVTFLWGKRLSVLTVYGSLNISAPFSAFNMTQTREYVDIELLRVDSLTFARDMNQTLARDLTEEIYRGHI